MQGLKDKVAIIGMGQTKLGDRFDAGFVDLAVEAYVEAIQDAGIEPSQIEAMWLGVFEPNMAGGFQGQAGSYLAEALGLWDRPSSRVSNYCATGMDALRNAAYAIAAGQYKIVLVLGEEKMRDVGSRDSLIRQTLLNGHPVIGKGQTAPGMFALMANRHFHEFGTTKKDLALVAVKNHYNGSLNPKAHIRKQVDIDTVMNAYMIADPLGLYDCSTVADGAAAAILTTPEIAKSLKPNGDYVLIKSIGLSITTDARYFDPYEQYIGFRSTQMAAKMAYEEAGIKNPFDEIGVAEVHDCFTITEIINYEDLFFVEKGKGATLIREGITALDGKLPVNTSGGLKSCGHPIGATGVRMTYQIYQQLLGRAGKMQVKNPKLGLIHNLGGPGSVAAVAIYRTP